MVSRERVTATHRKDVQASGALLSKDDREALVQPYLPSAPSAPAATTKPRRRPVRTFLRSQLHQLVFGVLHLFFSLYIHLRRLRHAVAQRVSAVLYYHHRTPELIRKDVRGLSRLPRHLSVILTLEAPTKEGLDRLLDQAAEVCAWTACAGIPLLSVYERTGALKGLVPATHAAVAAKLHAYFGPQRPSLQVRAPHMQTFLNGDLSDADGESGNDLGHLSLLLLSAEDGCSTMVDLTRTLAEMAQQAKLAPRDVTPELIDSELSESVAGEPDLLVLFSPHVSLAGYPPWQLRLTEIFCQRDNERVEYLVWLRALHRFAKAQMRFGR